MFNINPFRKKQGFQEEQAGSEPYLPPDLERFRAQPAESSILEIPERERKFKAFAREMENPQDIEFGFGEKMESAPAERSAPENKFNDNDKLDMILQKLETIDLRLKLIEQKMERRAV